MDATSYSKADIQEHALKLLARREHSRRELVNKLTSKGYDPLDIEAVIDDLASKRLQSDRRFADTYVNYRAMSGVGPRKIENELRERGVSETIIRESVYEVWTAAQWESIISEVCSKRFKQQPRTHEEMATQYRFLYQRGFEPEAIQRLLTLAAEPG